MRLLLLAFFGSFADSATKKELKQTAQTYRSADSVKIMKDKAIRGAGFGFIIKISNL